MAPILLDFSKDEPAPLRSRDVCDWMVTAHGDGSVSVHTRGFGCTFAVQFNHTALPQLKEAVRLLEAQS